MIKINPYPKDSDKNLELAGSERNEIRTRFFTNSIFRADKPLCLLTQVNQA